MVRDSIGIEAVDAATVTERGGGCRENIEGGGTRIFISKN